MSEQTLRRGALKTPNQLLCAYCGYAAMFTLFLGWVALAGFVPPPDPSDSPSEVADFFADNRTGIRIGLMICMLGCALFLPWWAVIAVQVKRIEGRFSPLAYTQIAAGACFVLEFLFPLTFWANAAFRPEASAESIQRLNDLAWIPFLGLVSTAVVQTFAIAIAVFQDTRARPIFPRWFAYYSVWSALIYTPAGLIIFFKNGPFAWNGFVSFWIVFAVFSTWCIVMTFLLVRAIKHQAEDLSDVPDDSVVAAELASLRAEVDRLAARDAVAS